MKKLNALTAAALVGLGGLALTAVPALACDGRGGQSQLMRMDADGDGKLTHAELTAGLSAQQADRLARVDVNKDGRIDAGERAAMEAQRAERRERGPGAGERGNGHHGKGGRAQGGGPGGGDRGLPAMARADRDGDGALDAGELRAAIETRAAHMMVRFDANKDGALDASELPRRGQRRG